MKKIVCAVVALLLALPAWAKLNAHEEARINAMLNALAQKKDLTFVRNGDAHNCEEAVSHLRLKLGNTRNRIDTAEQFIDKVASSSSITGKPYIVKIPGKSDENAQPYLHALNAITHGCHTTMAPRLNPCPLAEMLFTKHAGRQVTVAAIADDRHHYRAGRGSCDA